MKIIRLPFEDLELIHLRDSCQENPEEEDSGDENEAGSDDGRLYLPSPVFKLEAVALPGRGPAFPEGSISFEVPPDDMPRVAAWFSGNYQGVTRPPSATLIKNMISAIHSLLADFYKETSDAALFAAPFRLRWRWRLKGGSVYQPQEAQLIVPAGAAPLIVISDYGLGDKYLTSNVIIRQMPSRLSVCIPPLGSHSDEVTGIEFFATDPIELYNRNDSANGVRSADIDDSRVRIWHYDAPSEETNLLKAETDDNFSFLGAIPASLLTAAERIDTLPLPIDRIPLPDTPDQPDSGEPDQPPIFDPFFYAETKPLDLGDPEAFKRVTSLYLRGIFPRSSSESSLSDMELSLFGSIHRENWHLLARSNGPYIRGLCGVPCRWLKVRLRLTLRPGDFLDALTFTLNPV